MNATSMFFAELEAHGHEPILGRTSGTLRFDVADAGSVKHWYVTVKKGDITVSHSDLAADAVLRGDRSLFDGLAEGRVNPMAALLRGLLQSDGDLALLVSFQRLFPGPGGHR